MDNLIKKLTYAGLGFVSLGRQKAQEMANEIAEKTNLSEEEGKKLVDDLSEESEKLREDLNETVKEQVDKTLKKLEIPTREEVDDLKRRINRLEKEQENQEQHSGSNTN